MYMKRMLTALKSVLKWSVCNITDDETNVYEMNVSIPEEFLNETFIRASPHL